jgi:hypothetical protein
MDSWCLQLGRPVLCSYYDKNVLIVSVAVPLHAQQPADVRLSSVARSGNSQ